MGYYIKEVVNIIANAILLLMILALLF